MKAWAHNPAWAESGLRIYLHRIRKEQGVSIDDLAKDSGYSKSALHAWERGYASPNVVDLMNWAQALEYRLCVVPIDPKKPSPKQRAERQHEIDLQETKRT